MSPAAVFSQEDPSTLRWRIEDVSNQIAKVDKALAEKERILAELDEQDEKLRVAYLEIQDLDSKVRKLLRTNLKKSTITLAKETYDTITTPFNALEQSVRIIAGHIVKETLMKGMESTYSGTYQANIEGIRDESVELSPKLANVRRDMAKTLEEIREEASDGRELGETGLIYRKFRLVLDALEEAIIAIPDIRAKNELVKGNHQPEIDALNSRKASLVVQLADLQDRLVTARDELREQEAEAALALIASQTQPGTPVPTPTVSPQGGGETDLQQFLKYYNAATPVLDAHFPPYQQQLLTLRTRLRDDFALLQSELLAWKILDGTAIHPDTEALLGIELEDEGILRGNDPLSQCQSIHEEMVGKLAEVGQVEGRLEGALADGEDLLAVVAQAQSVMNEIDELNSFISAVEGKWDEIAPGSPFPEAYRLTYYVHPYIPPELSGFPPLETTRDELLVLMAAMEELEASLPDTLTRIESNRDLAEEVFNEVGPETRADWAKLEQGILDMDAELQTIFDIFDDDFTRLFAHPLGNGGIGFYFRFQGYASDYWEQHGHGHIRGTSTIATGVHPFIVDGDESGVLQQESNYEELLAIRRETAPAYMVARTRLLDTWSELLPLMLDFFSPDVKALDLELATQNIETDLLLGPPIDINLRLRFDDLEENAGIIAGYPALHRLEFELDFGTAVELARLKREIDRIRWQWFDLEESALLADLARVEGQLAAIVAGDPPSARWWAGAARQIQDKIDEQLSFYASAHGFSTLPPTILSEPEDITILEGDRGILFVGASGGGLRYDWDLTAGYTNTYLGSGGGPLLITEPLTETVSFTVRVSNPNGHVVSREATITVLPEGGGHPLPTATLSMPDFPGEGGTGDLVVQSADPSITWMVDFGVDWLDFDSGFTGQGDLTLPFTVAPNNLGIERSADLRVGETVLTIVQQPQVGDYTEWRDLHLPAGGGGRGPRDDYNGNGTSNFLCFCFGIDPTSHDVAARLPNFEFATDVFGEKVARYMFYQSKEATALPWQVLVTDDFGSWSEAEGTLRVIDDTGDAWLMSVERPLGNQPTRQFWQIEIPWPAGL